MKETFDRSGSPEGQSTEARGFDLTSRLEQGELFLREVMDVDDSYDIDLTMRQKYFGSLFRIPDFSEEKHFSSTFSGVPDIPNVRLSTIGLEAFDGLPPKAVNMEVYPFNDKALAMIHRRAMETLRNRALSDGTKLEDFWAEESIYWLTPFQEELFSERHAKTKEAAEQEVEEFRAQQNRRFGRNTLGARYDTKWPSDKASSKLAAESEKMFKDINREKFHKYLVKNRIMTEREIDYIVNFDNVREHFTEQLTNRILEVCPRYHEVSEYANRVYSERDKAVDFYYSRYKKPNPPNVRQNWEVTIGFNRSYAGQLTEQEEKAKKASNSFKEYVKRIERNDPLGERSFVAAPPLMPRIALPDIPREVRRGLKLVEKQELSTYLVKYEKESDFPFVPSVIRKFGGMFETAPDDIDNYIDRIITNLEGNPDADKAFFRQTIDNYRKALKKRYELLTIYNQAETMWGPVPPEENSVFYRLRRTRQNEVEEKSFTEAKAAYDEFAAIQKDLAVRFDLIEQSESEKAQVIFFPTGITALMSDGAMRYLAISPFDKRVLESLPEEYRDIWERNWDKYVDLERRGHSPFSKVVAAATNGIIEDAVAEYIELGDSTEARLTSLQKQYSFSTERIVNVRNGEINPQLDYYDVAAVAKIMPYFGDFISVVKKPQESQTISQKMIREEIKKCLGGADEDARRSGKPRTSGLSSLFRAGTLNIDGLRQLIQQDSSDAMATINLLTNCIGISIYDSLTPSEQKEFNRLVENSIDVSRKSFYQAFGEMVEDSGRRRELMRRVMFVTCYSKHVTGKAPEAFEALMEKISKPRR